MSYNSDHDVTPTAKPKRVKKINIVATHYVVNYQGELEIYDVIKAPVAYRTAYKRRLRGKTEGEWSALLSNNLVTSPVKARTLAVKSARKSIANDKKSLALDIKRLKTIQKLKLPKVPRVTKA